MAGIHPDCPAASADAYSAGNTERASVAGISWGLAEARRAGSVRLWLGRHRTPDARAGAASRAGPALADTPMPLCVARDGLDDGIRC